MAKKSVHETLKVVYEKKNLEKHTKKAIFFCNFSGEACLQTSRRDGLFDPT